MPPAKPPLAEPPPASGPATAPGPAPPHTGAVTGVWELLTFLRDPDYARRRFAELGDVFETVIAGQPQVFVRGPEPVADLMTQATALEGWWPPSVSQLLGPFSLSNRNGDSHLARRRAVGRLFSPQALRGYAPGIARICDAVVDDLAAAAQPQPLTQAADGTIALGEIEAAIKPDDAHFARTRLLALENTWGGKVLPQTYVQQAADLAHARGLATHLDPGALQPALRLSHQPPRPGPGGPAASDPPHSWPAAHPHRARRRLR